MGRRIMVVGNGQIEAGKGNRIDEADLVVRFNDCRSFGAGGVKTSIVAVCNTGRPGKRMLEEKDWRENRAVLEADAIWGVRDPEKFSAMRGVLATTHPELDDFCDDYTDGFIEFCRSSDKQFHGISAATYDQVDDMLAQYQPVPYVTPSSGAIVVAELLNNHCQNDDEVTIAGFSHEGWEWHPWQAEKAWMDALASSGRLKRL